MARETYRENVGDIYQLCRELSEHHDLPFQLSYSDAGGHVLTLKKTELEGQIPKGFINVTSKGSKWSFSSLELVSLLRVPEGLYINPLDCRRRKTRG